MGDGVFMYAKVGAFSTKPGGTAGVIIALVPAEFRDRSFCFYPYQLITLCQYLTSGKDERKWF